jgi:hypothetical protein
MLRSPLLVHCTDFRSKLLQFLLLLQLPEANSSKGNEMNEHLFLYHTYQYNG